jgi:hypothetical protein
MPLRWRSDAIIHMQFHKDWFRHSNLVGRDTCTDTRKHHCDHISLLFFFENKESRLKKYITFNMRPVCLFI